MFQYFVHLSFLSAIRELGMRACKIGRFIIYPSLRSQFPVPMPFKITALPVPSKIYFPLVCKNPWLAVLSKQYMKIADYYAVYQSFHVIIVYKIPK